MMKKIKTLITGGAGFIGSEFIRQRILQKKQKTVVIDKLSYAGDLDRIKNVKKEIIFYKSDIANKDSLEKIFNNERPDIIIHFASETHVDRSILDTLPFIKSNILGTQNLIDLSRKYKISQFLHISTDEVYGESKRGFFTETSSLRPRNPYAATKASAELLIKAAITTHQFPAIIIRPSNNYGPWQYPEKFIPVIILNALKNQKIPIYGKGLQIREWLHVSDCAKAIDIILKKGKIGEIYNVGSSFESSNISTVKLILKLLDKPQSLIQLIKDRPGHDFRYSIDSSKTRGLGWEPKLTFFDGINQTITWYAANKYWLNKHTSKLKKYWKEIYKK